MNIQIFGTSKCFDSKKAMRYFKERGIKYQWIDMKEKGLSKGEYTKVKQAVGGLDAMLNTRSQLKRPLMFWRHLLPPIRVNLLPMHRLRHLSVRMRLNV